MRRSTLIATLAVLLILTASAAGGWLALAPGAARFVVPGASDVHIRSLAPGTHEITFRVGQANKEWTSLLDRQLRGQGWLPPDYSGARAQFTIYSYVNHYWFGSIWEQADLQGDPQHARIVVRRWLRLGWLFTESIPL